MADTTLDIGFTVENDALKADLALAAQDFAQTSASILQSLGAIGAGAEKTVAPLKDFQRAASGRQAQDNDWKKAIEDQYAAEQSEVEMEKTLHLISADDAIAQEIRIEQAKFASLQQQLAMQEAAAAGDAALQQRLNSELESLRSQRDAKMRALDQKAVAESMQSWQRIIAPIGGAFQSSLNGIIQGHETLRQAVAKIGQSIVSDVVSQATKRAETWLASELTMTSGTEAGVAARKAALAAGDAEGKAAGATAGSASVFGDANKAAAGAFSAVAGIPYVGPVLAPVAAAAAFTAVMAYDVFSAEGGFDIPTGLNPMTQLHEREMVLPADIADPLRAGIASGGGAGGDIHIHAVDAQSFQRLLLNNKGALAQALRGAHRGFERALA